MSSEPVKCKNLIKTGLSPEEKKSIIDVHNQLRQKVASGQETRGKPGPQPAAKSMPNVEWDDELAELAQGWANQCQYGHDRNRETSRFILGENVALLSTTDDLENQKIEDMVMMWYNEVADHPKKNAASFSASSAKKCGHYTQMVWANSTLIGCGAVKYKEGKFNKFLLVCKYGPGGNIVGAPIYEVKEE